MMKIKKDFKTALNLLVSYYYHDIDLKYRNDLAAIITHWLQMPDSKPILANISKDKWKEILIKYSLFDEGLIGIDNLLKDKYPKTGLEINFNSIPMPPPLEHKFTFIDLFAGIGGFRIALQNLGGKCVFSCEWENSAKKTYFNNFGEIPFGDISQFTSSEISDEELDKIIPDHNILAAGFPCQPFSKAGVSARNSLGQKTGFNCELQGNLFFDIVRIAKVKKPDVLFLENVKNLKSHDGGNTFQTIKDTIENELGYDFNCEVIDSSSLVPQRRERCFMVCFRKKRNNFQFPTLNGESLPLKLILEDNVPENYTISDKLWQGHIKRTKRNIERGTGFTAFEADLNKPSKTIVARYYKDGKECLVPQKNKNPRKLTPRECARLQGFPDEFVITESNTSAYKQFGNSVPVPVVYEVAKNIMKELY